ncbi:hypothetical protein B0T22DRAFT_295204 [Podospora appendiculata]|uniref:Uncharacterized protein n=1 Tax=Podospora appendiculata TaxID=314037 RepID=A0AAE1C8H8_9PEZI|nr:hypothetical protein B0T22DRAFT_295204 [Podospora appendiculata]
MVERPWTIKELDNLFRLCRNGVPLDRIKEILGIPPTEVECNYEKYHGRFYQNRTLPIDTYLPPSSLLSANQQDRVVNRRLLKVLDVLLACDPHPLWCEVLARRTAEEWASELLAHIPRPVQTLLSRPDPPTIAQLKQLPLHMADQPGVYGKGLRSDHRPSRALVDDQGGRCETGRKFVREPHGYFFNLLTLRWPTYRYGSASEEIIPQLRDLARIGEAVLMTYMGALSHQPQSREQWVLNQHLSPLFSAGPWDAEEVVYKGMSGLNPLWCVNNYEFDLRPSSKGNLNAKDWLRSAEIAQLVDEKDALAASEVKRFTRYQQRVTKAKELVIRKQLEDDMYGDLAPVGYGSDDSTS